jgi:hypothetical protein
LSNLIVHRKDMYYVGTDVFNSLPSPINDLSYNIRQFETAVEKFLHLHSSYTLDEYFKHNKI